MKVFKVFGLYFQLITLFNSVSPFVMWPESKEELNLKKINVIKAEEQISCEKRFYLFNDTQRREQQKSIQDKFEGTN